MHGQELACTLLWLASLNIGWDWLYRNGLWNYVIGGNFPRFQRPPTAIIPAINALQRDRETVYAQTVHAFTCPYPWYILAHKSSYYINFVVAAGTGVCHSTNRSQWRRSLHIYSVLHCLYSVGNKITTTTTVGAITNAGTGSDDKVGILTTIGLHAAMHSRAPIRKGLSWHRVVMDCDGEILFDGSVYIKVSQVRHL